MTTYEAHKSRGAKRRNLYVTVPCHGRIMQTLLDAPEGRHWPNDGDQILREGWIDSVEALRIARAATHPKSPAGDAREIQQFELSSRANVTDMGTLRPPFREGVFPMETSWRISFSVMSENARTVSNVTVPAYGHGVATLTVHAFDKHGSPLSAASDRTDAATRPVALRRCHREGPTGFSARDSTASALVRQARQKDKHAWGGDSGPPTRRFCVPWGYLAAGDGADDQKWLCAERHGLWQRVVRRFVRPIFAARKKAQKGPSLQRVVVADRAPQHGIASLECVQDGALRDRTLNLNAHFHADVRQSPQMRRQYNSNHGSVCTSTESTAGRSRTMGAQLFPASRDAYTCPPVVPKYTPQVSSASTAMASRNTFT